MIRALSCIAILFAISTSYAEQPAAHLQGHVCAATEATPEAVDPVCASAPAQVEQANWHRGYNCQTNICRPFNAPPCYTVYWGYGGQSCYCQDYYGYQYWGRMSCW